MWRIGDYLQKAHLISPSQIDFIKEKQAKSSSPLRLGELIVYEGYVSKQTMDWFIEFQYVLKFQKGKNPTFKQVYQELESFPIVK